jgi:hypothetical protein
MLLVSRTDGLWNDDARTMADGAEKRGGGESKGDMRLPSFMEFNRLREVRDEGDDEGRANPALPNRSNGDCCC